MLTLAVQDAFAGMFDTNQPLQTPNVPTEIKLVRETKNLDNKVELESSCKESFPLEGKTSK